jgi:hypothetical protein
MEGAFLMMDTDISFLIPVLATGIQPRRVCAVNDRFGQLKESSAPKDMRALDSRDEHRNEGWGDVVALPSTDGAAW